MLAVIVVIINQTVIWQVALMVTQIVTSVILLGNVAPYREAANNQMEIFNEIVIMFVMYHMICFTPFVHDVYMKYNLGYSVCLFVSFHLVVNFYIMIKGSLFGVKKSYYLALRKKEFNAKRLDLLRKYRTGYDKRHKIRKLKRRELRAVYKQSEAYLGFKPAAQVEKELNEQVDR